MKHLEMIELEPYEAPALEEIRTAVLLHGQTDDNPTDTNPAGDDEIPGGDNPLPDDF